MLTLCVQIDATQCVVLVQSLEVVSFYRVGVVANRGGRTPCIEQEQLCVGYILYRSASNT